MLGNAWVISLRVPSRSLWGGKIKDPGHEVLKIEVDIVEEERNELFEGGKRERPTNEWNTC